MNFRCAIYLTFFAAVTGMVQGCEKDVIKHDVEAELQQLIVENNLPSLSTAIFKDGELVWSQIYGYRNRENGTLADEETMYHIGSISKLFIVTGVMQLEEQGRIDLDEDINVYLPVQLRHPQFPDFPITTRMLLTHTAGLSWPQSYDGNRGMWNEFEPDQSPAPSEWIPEYLVPSGQHYDPALWKPNEPGEYEFYSNIGLCVVAYLVEQVSGINFREYCKQNIFIPLGMHNTSFSYADLNSDDIAVMYDASNHATPYYDNRVYVAGGAKSTIQDMGRFATCYMNNGELDGQRILQESTVQKILQVQNQASGLCLTWQSYLGNWFGHTGRLLYGTTANLMMQPDENVCLIIFTNAHTASVLPGGDIFWLIRQKANEFVD